MKKIKVLILTAPFGNGHVSVANEIVRELNGHPNTEAILYDLYSEEYRRTTNILKKYHLKQYKKGIAQVSYKFFYYRSGKLLNSWVAHYYNHFGMKPLIAKIKKEQPDLILNTFPVNCSYYLQEEGIDLPIYTMITDYYANENWFHQAIACHFVASERVAQQLLDHRISPEKIELTGIPVKEKFLWEKTKEEKDAIREKYAINSNHRVVLFVAGAKGVIPKFSSIVQKIKELANLTLLVVCGSNEKLYKELNEKHRNNKNVHVFPYVYDMDELMAVSDLMITKPGGITVTESCHMGLPLILYKPIYGQELENARYFEKNKAAIVTYNQTELIESLEGILKDDERLTQMKQNIKNLAQKDSAKRIALRMMNDLSEQDGDHKD